jgi:hypothetical protein
MLLSVWRWNKRRGLCAAGHDVEAGIEELAKLVARELSHAMFNSLRRPSRQPSLSGDMASRAGSSDDRAPSFTCPYSGSAGSGVRRSRRTKSSRTARHMWAMRGKSRRAPDGNAPTIPTLICDMMSVYGPYACIVLVLKHLRVHL